MSLIFVFIDGVGLAPAGPDNPLTDADTPALRALLGGPLTIERASAPHPPAPLRLRSGQASPTQRGGEQLLPCPPSWEKGIGDGGRRPMLFKAIDATLGVMGLPQSGTGQAALSRRRGSARRPGGLVGCWQCGDAAARAEHRYAADRARAGW